MFWGKGDSSKLDDEQRRTLENLRRLVETGHVIALDSDQAQLAIEALDWYQQWTSVMKLARSVRNTALLVAGLLALWWGMQDSIRDWFLGFLGGGS